MLDTNKIFEDILKVLTNKRIINIYGKSGTGKTTLALHIIGIHTLKSFSQNEYFIWIQASEEFPQRRLKTLFETSPKMLNKLRKRILITPKNNICKSYKDQREIINKFLSNDTVLPPNVKYIIIDNISHHLRYEINKIDDIKKVSAIIDNFFNTQLFPFIMYCHREGINLILLHEMTYNPKLNQNLKFLDGIYKRLDSLNIYLEDEFMTKSKKMEINLEEFNWRLNYNIRNNGFIFKG